MSAVKGAGVCGVALDVPAGRPGAYPEYQELISAPFGFYVEPTVVGGVSQSMTIAREEIFGPVASVITFRIEEEGPRIANDSTYGLAASVRTRDIGTAHWCHVA